MKVQAADNQNEVELMVMITIVKNILLLSGAVLSLMFTAVFARILFTAKRMGKRPYEGQQIPAAPTQELKTIFKSKILLPKVTLAVIMTVLCGVMFCGIYSLWGVVWAAVLCVPTGAVLVYVSWQLIRLLCRIVRSLVALDSPKFNIMFSIAIVNLLIVYLSIIPHSENFGGTFTFCLGVYNLIFGYVTTMALLLMLLKDANSSEGKLTYKNLWKATILIIIMFVLTLTAFSYIGVLHFATGFNVSELSYFDILYYTVVTFATAGYGDIVPVNMYNKAITILTLSTSVVTITVLLSTMLSVHKQDKTK